ncbi:MAG: hypothetical protein ACREEM_49620 [Blastocatellia bacterium]
MKFGRLMAKLDELNRLLPLGTLATLEAWAEQTDGRKVSTRGRLLDSSGEPFAEGKGLFAHAPA